KKYTPKFQEILNSYDLKLNGDWNKVKMPHRGRHPNEYHEYILEKMSKIDKIARGDVGGKIKCRKRKIKCRIFATNYLSFNLKLKL
ncbi:TPA: AHH domain-containing protein, partial [Campylobacter jejuni]